MPDSDLAGYWYGGAVAEIDRYKATISQLRGKVAELEAEIYRRSHMAPKDCCCWVCAGGKK